jgi:CDP-ribitol ribitolphosphotransferase
MFGGVKKWLKGNLKKNIKDFLYSKYFPSVYERASKQPIQVGKVIFLDVHKQEMPDDFRLLYQQLREQGSFTSSFEWITEGDLFLYEFWRKGTALVKDMATAEFIILHEVSKLESSLSIRPETEVIQVWHGCGAFKKFGMSTADLIFGPSREQLLLRPQHKNVSLVTVSSPEVVWAYQEAMVIEDKPEVVQPLGVSRTDMFFDEAYVASSRAHVKEIVPAIQGKKVLLYAPTFRGRVASALAPDELDIEALQNELSREWVLLIKHHPHVRELPEIPESCRDFAFDVSSDLTVNELLCVADACISDYSSLVFEYSLFEKPLIFFAFDKAEYDDWRGFYYNYDELTPGPVCTTTQEIIDYVRSLDEGFDPSEVRAFREKFMSACDGHATERIVNHMLEHRVM